MTNSPGMAAGLPVITTPVGCLDEIVRDGVNGFLCQPGDIDALTSAILKLGSDPDLRYQMGVTNRGEFIQRYSLKFVIDKIEKIYQELLGGETR